MTKGYILSLIICIVCASLPLRLERAVAVPAGKVAETTDKPDDGPGRSRAE
jgi:hypothetical protein